MLANAASRLEVGWYIALEPPTCRASQPYEPRPCVTSRVLKGLGSIEVAEGTGSRFFLPDFSQELS